MGKSKELIERERLEYIDALLNDVENAAPVDITDSQISLIDSLLLTSIIEHEKREEIRTEMFKYSYSEALECIDMLNLNQVDPIEAGNNYSQTDINKKLDKLGL